MVNAGLYRAWLFVIWAAVCWPSGYAEAGVFKCVGAEGKVTYQDSPCDQGSSETTIRAPNAAAPAGVRSQPAVQGSTPAQGAGSPATSQPAPASAGVENRALSRDPCNNARDAYKPLPASAAALAAKDRVLLENRCGVASWATEAAIAAATPLGAAADANALKVIVDLVSVPLLHGYSVGFDRRTDLVPPAIEQIILANLDYKYSGLREGLVRLLWAPRGCAHRYASRELFDGLRSRYIQNPTDYFAKALTCSALPDIDEKLAALLAVTPLRYAYEDISPLVRYFSEHPTSSAVPALVAIQAALPLFPCAGPGGPLHAGCATPGGLAVGFVRSIDVALLAIGNDEAIQAVDQRIQWLAQDPTNRYLGAQPLMSAISFSPPNSRLRYESVRVLWKAFPEPTLQRSFVAWVKKRDIREAIPDLYDAIDTESAPVIVAAILEFGTPADWRQLDHWIGANVHGAFWASAQSKQLREQVHLAAQAPDTVIAQRAERDRQQAFADARSLVATDRKALGDLRKTDPKRYLAREEELLKRSAGLAEEYHEQWPAARNWARETIQGYRRLAGYRRFWQRDPRGAVETYQRGIALPFDAADPGGDPRIALHIEMADTLRFDLHDRSGALREYRQALTAVTGAKLSTNDFEAALHLLSVAWLNAEIAFLDNGARPARADEGACEGIVLAIGYGRSFAADDPELEAIVGKASPGKADMDRAELARRLNILTPTPIHMLATVEQWPAIGTADGVAAFLRKHDPSGFLTACLLRNVESMAIAVSGLKSLAGESQNANGPWAPADVRLMQEVSRLVLGAPSARELEARKQLADPEATWRTFLAALRAADLPAAWRCMTPGLRSKFEPGFAQMTPAQLRAMADSFTDFKLTGAVEPYREAAVTANGRAGFIYFVNTGGEWRIQEM